jgi:isopenicillin-N N-acyltransferase like protein
MLRTLELTGRNPRHWGEQHGESFRDDIRSIAALRMQLTIEKTDLATRDNVLELAAAHLPILRRFDGALCDELEGIAAGAKLSAAEIIVLNHYTDLRDLRLADLQSWRDPGGCTAVYTRTDDGVVLGQTWDMHGSAEPYALMMTIPQNADDTVADKVNGAGIPKTGKTVVFSITGCLGMTGFTSWGLGLTINNLNSIDATLGAVWSATVRQALRQRDAKAAFASLQAAPIGSGRHYMVADTRDVFAMETSGTQKKTLLDGTSSSTYVHTNHCVDADMARTCRVLPGSTTMARYDAMTKAVAGRRYADARAVFDAFDVVGLMPKADAPHDVTTCGALVMNLSRCHGVACQGRPSAHADAVIIEAVAS